VQSDTKAHVDKLTSPAGHPVTVLRFEGDIASTSKDAVLGTYQALPKESAKVVLLDFSKVDYINSSGIALVIQMLIEASNSAQKVYAFGLSRWWASPSMRGCSLARARRWRRCRKGPPAPLRRVKWAV
jgi:anti-anti-sigma regulatory factor